MIIRKNGNGDIQNLINHAFQRNKCLIENYKVQHQMQRF